MNDDEVHVAGKRWYQRCAWIYFVAIAAVGLLLGAATFVDPASGTDTFERFGFEAPSAIETDPDVAHYLDVVFEWTAGATIGFDLFGIVIAATAFRRGERWAWLVFWWWPVMFVSHFILYESAFRWFQLVWAALAVAALLATAPMALAPRPPVPPRSD